MEKTRDDKHLVDMDNTRITSDYLQAVKAIKQAILESRYRAARLVNKEVLALYYAIGGYISVRSRAAKWGTNAIGVISDLLQQELPGLRGFSETNIKRMRIFYEEWRSLFENRPLLADELEIPMIPMGNSEHITIRPLTTDEMRYWHMRKSFSSDCFILADALRVSGAVRNCCITLAKTCILKKGPCPTILL